MSNKLPKFNRFPNTGKWTARYWCKIEMSKSHTLDLATRFQSTGDVTANLLKELAPLEPHWRILFMRGNKICKVRRVDGNRLIQERHYAG